MTRHSILSVISTILWTVLFHAQLFAAEAKIEGLILDKQINELLVLDVNSYEDRPYSHRGFCQDREKQPRWDYVRRFADRLVR